MLKKFLTAISMLVLSIVLIEPADMVNAASFNQRIAGQTRYETSAKIAQQGWTNSKYAVIASDAGFADALSAAPLAKKYNAPILLTGGVTLDSNTKSELQSLGVKNVFLIGGTGSISDNVKSKLESMNIIVTRISGKDRFETSLEIAKSLGNFTGVVVTNAYGFADALSIAPVAASQGMPILLISPNTLPSEVKSFLNSSKYSKTYIVGGTGVVSDSVASQLKNITRLTGSSRYGTNAAVLNQFSSTFNYDKVYVASGKSYPDALSGSVLAAKTNSPLILVGSSVDSSVMSSVKAQHDKYNNVIVLGGTGVVSDASENIIVSGVDNTIVTFKDNKLEQAVRRKINKPTGNIYKSDVESITELDYRAPVPDCILAQSGIGDISGIENLENLESLDLGSSHISDISPLEGLTNLKSLTLFHNPISDDDLRSLQNALPNCEIYRGN